MPRYRITIEYDGTSFVGWQKQSNGPSIQSSLQDALFKFTHEKVQVHGAGRTDSGVHAIGQAAHFDLKKVWAPGKIEVATNYYLKPLPVSIVACSRTADTFNARFSAIERHYLYRILPRRAPAVLNMLRVWQVPVELDLKKMQEAAILLVGSFNFATFQSAKCQAKSSLRTLNRLDVVKNGEEICIYASARAFLQNQVRSMVGCLKAVGEGSWTINDFISARDSCDRQRCATVAPAHGLYLTTIDYPNEL
ncbi:MAG: tRNA pseudouridine(38-40) synthase TruA [Hyphomicrobiaceae bacterium]|nr:tRNA pseudouridine(38-40) synthase TruA [Hyphomicrobiaceae bacterium]